MYICAHESTQYIFRCDVHLAPINRMARLFLSFDDYYIAVTIYVRKKRKLSLTLRIYLTRIALTRDMHV